MKKLLLQFSLITFFVCLFFVSQSKNEVACAKQYGPSESCPLDGSSVGTHYSSGISSVSVSFYVTLLSGSVPAGTRAWVQLGTNPNETCGGELQCLTRYDEASIALDQGAKTYSPITLEKVGCSESGCRVNGQDLIVVSAYLTTSAGTPLPASAGCSNAVISGDEVSQGKLNITNANNQSRVVYVSFTCTPPVSTPTPTIPACIKPAAPIPTVTCDGCT